ncbi:MAG TPA: TIGR00730 family Rossman fold protein [Vicinamibacteria bacterium]|nr:TIGR00730 family Rossman fold protein [Vicinamibacteria bacterium]
MRRLCVFCGSSPGLDPRFREAAERLGDLLVRRRLGLVYGGSGIGLMGVVADAVLARGGEVIGVIPKALARKEVAHQGLGDLRVVGSMHERKALMADLSDAFVALPGGLGTLDELCEILTWGQLGLHTKPTGILNVAGYFDRFLDFLDHGVSQRLIRAEHRGLVLVESEPEVLLDRFLDFRPVTVEKWLRPEEG